MCGTREIGRPTVRDRCKDVNLSHVGMVGLIALEPTHLFPWNVEYHPCTSVVYRRLTLPQGSGECFNAGRPSRAGERRNIPSLGRSLSFGAAAPAELSPPVQSDGVATVVRLGPWAGPDDAALLVSGHSVGPAPGVRDAFPWGCPPLARKSRFSGGFRPFRATCYDILQWPRPGS